MFPSLSIILSNTHPILNNILNIKIRNEKVNTLLLHNFAESFVQYKSNTKKNFHCDFLVNAAFKKKTHTHKMI